MSTGSDTAVSIHFILFSANMTDQIVSQQLHDECGILVALFAQCVELGNSIIKSLLCEVASLIGRIEDLIVEDREVEGETKTDRVGWGEVSAGNFGGVLVGFEGLVGRDLALITHGELRQVTVVVSLPVEEND
jgi:hypothetical protein